MLGRRQFTIAGLSAAALAATNAVGLGQAAPGEKKGTRNDAYDKCAAACSACQRECDYCATHCAEQLAGGTRHHLATLQSCRDCADVCSTAAEIVARHGPMSTLICQTCADACAQCAKACEQHGRDDKTMQKCAEECRNCEKACRQMLSQATADRKTQ